MKKQHPKMLEARTEIEAVLRKHDIAGVVTLCMPEYIEHFSNYDEPSFSRLQKYDVTPHGYSMRLRSKLADYNGDAEAQKRDLQATAGMISAIAELLARESISLMSVSKVIDKALGTTHTPLEPI